RRPGDPDVEAHGPIRTADGIPPLGQAPGAQLDPGGAEPRGGAGAAPPPPPAPHPRPPRPAAAGSATARRSASSSFSKRTAPSLSRGLLPLPHLGDWTQEGQPVPQ